MTGRYTYRLGTQATVIRADVPFGVPLSETFMSENLVEAGYTTALFGKVSQAAAARAVPGWAVAEDYLPRLFRMQWHLGFYQRAYTPLERGFGEHLGYYQGCIDYYEHTGGGYGNTPKGVDWHRGNESTCYSDDGNYTSTLIVPEAIGFIQRMDRVQQQQTQAQKPYFLYLPFHLIHGPNQVPQKYEDLYDAARPGLDPEMSAESQGLCGVCACPSHSSGANASWAQCRTVLGMAAALDEAVGTSASASASASASEQQPQFLLRQYSACPCLIVWSCAVCCVCCVCSLRPPLAATLQSSRSLRTMLTGRLPAGSAAP